MRKGKNKRKLSFFNRLILLLNLLAVLGLLLSYLSVFISPVKVWPVAFFGLSYPVIFFINVLFIGFWLVQRKRQFMLSFFALFLGIGFLGRFMQFNDQKPEKDLKDYFKVVSYNVHAYNRREWKDDKNKKFTSQFIRFFKKQQPDILCLQEHLAYGDTERKIREMVRQKAGLNHYYLKKYHNTHGKSQCLGIFTRYPILKYGMKQKDWQGQERTYFIFADLKLATDTVRIYSVHLQSIQLSKEHIIFDEQINLKDSEYNRKLKEESISMARKLKYAFQKRALQIQELREHVEKSPHPVVVCGDFNDTPTSYAYQKISKILKDSYKEAGSGKSQTYSGKYPSFRIDYIFHDPEIQAANMKIFPRAWSDHYPLVTYLKIED